MNASVLIGRTPDIMTTVVLASCLIVLALPLQAECDPAWDWACEQVDDCRQQIFGDPASWRFRQMPSSVISTVGVQLDTDGFLDARILVGVSTDSLPFVEVLVAEGFPIFDQLVSLRRHFPGLQPRDIFGKIKTRKVVLGQDALRELQAHMDSLKNIRVPIVLDRRRWILHVHGLNAMVFVAPGIGDYRFSLNLPRTEDSAPPDDALGAWAWALARWLDSKVGLTVHDTSVGFGGLHVRFVR